MTAVSRCLGPLRPGRGVLLWGESIRFLAAAAAAWGVAQGGQVLAVDAANRFDPHLMVREGRGRGLAPSDLLARVKVARAFTCHQLARLLQEELSRHLGAGCLVLVLGPVSLFYDEQVSLAERRRLFNNLVQTLARVKTQAPLLALQPYLPRGAPNRHFGRRLRPIMDYLLEVGNHGKNGFTLQPVMGKRTAALAEVPPGAAPGRAGPF
ncbi:MAG: hypothetical protein AB1491_03890 [Thermodesulfobacteriota bacterium]